MEQSDAEHKLFIAAAVITLAGGIWALLKSRGTAASAGGAIVVPGSPGAPGSSSGSDPTAALTAMETQIQNLGTALQSLGNGAAAAAKNAISISFQSNKSTGGQSVAGSGIAGSASNSSSGSDSGAAGANIFGLGSFSLGGGGSSSSSGSSSNTAQIGAGSQLEQYNTDNFTVSGIQESDVASVLWDVNEMINAEEYNVAQTQTSLNAQQLLNNMTVQGDHNGASLINGVWTTINTYPASSLETPPNGFTNGETFQQWAQGVGWSPTAATGH